VVGPGAHTVFGIHMYPNVLRLYILAGKKQADKINMKIDGFQRVYSSFEIQFIGEIFIFFNIGVKIPGP
jgi:hypothetical protein